MWDLEEDKIFFFQQQSEQGAQPDPPLLSALKPWCFCEHHKSKGQFARVHGEGFARAVRTVMENTPETSSSELKSLWGSPTEGEVFREREQLFLWALLEMHSQVFWLDRPLKAYFTSCRSASCCPLLPVGHKKKKMWRAGVWNSFLFLLHKFKYWAMALLSLHRAPLPPLGNILVGTRTWGCPKPAAPSTVVRKQKSWSWPAHGRNRGMNPRGDQGAACRAPLGVREGPGARGWCRKVQRSSAGRQGFICYPNFMVVFPPL